MRFLQKRRRVSERRACRLVSQHRSTQRYQRVEPAYELRLVARMNELAARYPRYGYRRIWALLSSEGWHINRERIERLWRLEGHRVRRAAVHDRAAARRQVVDEGRALGLRLGLLGRERCQRPGGAPMRPRPCGLHIAHIGTSGSSESRCLPGGSERPYG